MSTQNSPTPTSTREHTPDGLMLLQQPVIPLDDTTVRDDTALLVGLSLWIARQHERDLAASPRPGDRPRHSYPAVLVETLTRHADAGDPTCRLVLDWLQGKGLIVADARLAPRRGTV